jgi:predicted MFS family arabinose efflux permease
LLRLGGDSFGWAMSGQALVAIAQPLVLGAITRTVSRSLPPASRTAGIAVSSAGIFTGMVLALVLGASFGDERLHALLVVQAVIGAVSALALVVAVRAWPGSIPESADETASDPRGGIRSAWADPVMRRLAALSLAGFGVFVALTTWLQALTEPAGVSARTAGAVLAGAVAAGVVVSGVVPDLVVRRRAEPAALRWAVIAAAAGCVVLAFVSVTAVVAVSTIVVVAALLAALPILLDLCGQRSQEHAATAANLIWLAGNLGGLLVALIVGVLIDHPSSAFLLMAVVALAALPLLPRGVVLGSPRPSAGGEDAKLSR